MLTYRVFENRVIEPDDTEAIRADPERDLLTLITCTPLGINTWRILVTAERLFPTPKADIDNAGAPSELPRFPWWVFVFAALLAGVFAWLWWNIRIYKRTKKRMEEKASEGRKD